MSGGCWFEGFVVVGLGLMSGGFGFWCSLEMFGKIEKVGGCGLWVWGVGVVWYCCLGLWVLFCFVLGVLRLFVCVFGVCGYCGLGWWVGSWGVGFGFLEFFGVDLGGDGVFGLCVELVGWLFFRWGVEWSYKMCYCLEFEFKFN